MRVSKAMALSTSGSPTHRANAKAKRPASRPTSIPRTSRLLAIRKMFLVTGEAEQMPSVMHEFVHVAAMNQRGSPLLCADKVDRQQHQQTAKHSPGQKLTDRNGRKSSGLRNRDGGSVGHLETSWDRASRVELIWR